ncbi:MAG TPA: N,N-dimethylformamidase beta subunit family domain-containing protein [Candidatus Andersenbacteria bacterium]|nr:N,N-dimethylformamidase beta subunit family domain-containing protein [Candidatus Andersenbacteria bacterium]
MLRVWIKTGFVFAVLIILISKLSFVWAPYVWPVHIVIKSYDGWRILRHVKNHEIEGYASNPSIVQGQTLDLHISSKTPDNSATIFRLGWYGGVGAQKITALSNIHAIPRKIPSADSGTGLVQPNWPITTTVQIPSNWRSGIYLIKLKNQDGFESYIPFVVKDASPHASIALVHTDTTDQAYNAWGGNSLYRGSTKKLGVTRAVTISLDRPLIQNDGAGYILEWEYPMIKFLEKNGYNISYISSSDIVADPNILKKFKSVLLIGHDEYWTKIQFDAYEDAVKSGVNLGIFAANTDYRQVRINNRVLIGYKDSYKSDPEFDEDETQATTEWRSPIVHRPESTLIGAMFATQVPKAFPLVITNPNHWVFAGTNVTQGQAIPGMVGYECDKVFSGFPKPNNLEVLTESPVVNMKDAPDVCQSTIYQAPSGAYVFNAGTIQWSSALDSFHSRFGENPIIQQVTKNILNKFEGLSNK